MSEKESKAFVFFQFGFSFHLYSMEKKVSNKIPVDFALFSLWSAYSLLDKCSVFFRSILEKKKIETIYSVRNEV